jgi:hypothetical protein
MSRVPPRFLLCAGVVALVLTMPPLAIGQTPPARPAALDEQAVSKALQEVAYQYLRERREVLQREIPTIQNELEGLQSRLRHFDRIDEDLATARENLAAAMADRSVTAEARRRLKDRVTFLEFEAKRRDRELVQVKSDADQRQATLKQSRLELDNVEREINRRIDIETPRQDFKKAMSFAFAALVAVVILGFFAIAGRDETVRRDVFSGQAGLQFIALFALIIAIILFGIVDILEGKELAALLGGLSGYILGRSSGGKLQGAADAAQ